MLITLQELRDAGACPDGLAEFEKAFGQEAVVTRGNLLKMRRHVHWLVRSHPKMRPYAWSFQEATRRRWEDYIDAATSQEELRLLSDGMGFDPDDGVAGAAGLVVDHFYGACASDLWDLLKMEGVGE